MLLLFFPVMMFFSLLFMRMRHPLSMGLVLLLQTCLVCLSSGLLSLSYWFSYILFLVFLGGMLVLFIYVASLAPNEPFQLKLETTVFLLFSLFMVFLILVVDMMWIPTPVNVISSGLETSLGDLSYVSTIYSDSVMNFTLFIVLYLLLTLFVVVEITGSYFGPLRFMT
uniref:NADH-ubiquinone oxidoreductase chain 6 n=1 Tax=Nihonotrypaea japonica TaxID=2734676 RepID=L7ZBY2_NIHJA|nr:NADH dehydrogenase subunit 6 [Neotrypaea japonica]AGE12449.1 NADH dehydrogenase subunit 6 [Neotrypaea japonica]URF19379.1 NADH dehydrogenase subunit 6 [Neotrypaea japonica]URF19392.1 NADH dehydrogenase subunit 6 [Neotrypaea japonica]URF19405.1 NADH dehydrogenase subunit 6 [Neotrypaea japonica]URF19418.1 NADH dehydrogenase subunit 6 [Neotrypaea japonica]